MRGGKGGKKDIFEWASIKCELAGQIERSFYTMHLEHVTGRSDFIASLSDDNFINFK